VTRESGVREGDGMMRKRAQRRQGKEPCTRAVAYMRAAVARESARGGGGMRESSRGERERTRRRRHA